jgi:hypothetical protein
MRGWSTSGSRGSDYGEKSMARVRCGARRLRSSTRGRAISERSSFSPATPRSRVQVGISELMLKTRLLWPNGRMFDQCAGVTALTVRAGHPFSTQVGRMAVMSGTPGADMYTIHSPTGRNGFSSAGLQLSGVSKQGVKSRSVPERLERNRLAGCCITIMQP